MSGAKLTVAEVIAELTDEERARWVWRGLFGPRLQHAGLLRRIAAARIAARAAAAAELARIVALAEGEAARRVYFSLSAEKSGDREAARDGIGGAGICGAFAELAEIRRKAASEPGQGIELAEAARTCPNCGGVPSLYQWTCGACGGSGDAPASGHGVDQVVATLQRHAAALEKPSPYLLDPASFTETHVVPEAIRALIGTLAAREAEVARLRREVAEARGVLQGVSRTRVEGDADLTLIDESHPCANGRRPVHGEQAWTFRFKLEDGRKVDVRLGREGRDNFRAMMLAEEMDDAAESERH